MEFEKCVKMPGFCSVGHMPYKGLDSQSFSLLGSIVLELRIAIDSWNRNKLNLYSNNTANKF